ncbi:MAG: hypothetical protein LBE51_18070, partial [Acidovorax sp.]|nr:hypothetical protein [Acidovorax sp.]
MESVFNVSTQACREETLNTFLERVYDLLAARQCLCGMEYKGAAPRARYRSNSRAIARIRN